MRFFGSTGASWLSTGVVRLGVGAFMLFGVMACAVQLGAQSYFADRILPGVPVDGVTIAGMTRPEARVFLRQHVKAYRIKLVVAGQPQTVSPAELGIRYKIAPSVDSAYHRNRNIWRAAATKPVALSASIQPEALSTFTQAIGKRVGTPAVDASVRLDGSTFVSVPDSSGWSIDEAALAARLRQASLGTLPQAIRVAPSEQVANIRTRDVEPAIQQAQLLRTLPVAVQYDGRTFTPSDQEVSGWLVFDTQSVIPGASNNRLVPKVDRSKVKGYVQTVANTINVAPVDKQVTVENGVARTTKEGTDGLAIDQDALVNAIASGLNAYQPVSARAVTRPVAYKTQTSQVTSLDYNRYLEVDLSRQHIWVWQDHAVIFDAPITSGATGAGYPTVTGMFSIYYKTTNTHLVGNAYGPRYNYDVQVDYWMPFYSGYGFHDASWRNGKFGGQDYYYGGSHGCINLPDAAAAFIYTWANVGTPVWVHP